MSIRRNPNFAREVMRDGQMRSYLAAVASEAASEVKSRLPYPEILGGLEVSDDVKNGPGGWEGEVRVKGSGWHLWEFGTVNHGARPAIRPGVQAALSRYGGRLGMSR